MKLRFPLALLFATALILTGGASIVSAQTAKLAWDASTDSTIAGYRISYGSRSGAYTQTIDAGKVTQYTVAGLDVSLNYYFAVQSYNSAGVQSAYSNEAELPAPVPPGTTTISALAANSGYPVLAGTPVTWTTAASSLRGPVQYKYFLYSPQTGWTVVQDYTQNPTFTWTPDWSDLGSNHMVQVWVRTVGSTAPYEAWVGTAAFDVVANQVQLTADVDFPTPPNNPVHWKATVAGASSAQLEYKFFVQNQGTGAWTLLRDYAASNQVTWTPTTTGNYVLQVWVRRVGSTATYEVWAGTPAVSVAKTTLQITLTADRMSPVQTGTAITWTARPKGGTAGPIKYQFFRYSAASGWVIVQPYSTSNTYTWTPAWGEEGQYQLQVWATNGGSAAAYDTWRNASFEIQPASLLVTVGSAFPVPPGTPVTLTGRVGDTSATFEYAFYLYSRVTGTWSVARAYNTNNAFTWTPAATGSYLFQVWARKVGSSAAYEVYGQTNYLDVAVGPAKLTTVTADAALPAQVGTAITWTATGVGGTASPLQYKFFMYSDTAGWTIMQDWSTQNDTTWTPTTADIGNHLVQVWVRSAGSTAAYEGWLQSGYFIIQP
jgi:fibronectin type III domain protein